ncbi:hypothetical protein [Neorhizobium tomejilense]|uniref:hypothetical protein n=1 Tax=Neorhizobium tomejilense TaxID=2093828 RepID=UPI00155EA5E9|nr:hypothetical protein [Neorhizobium tomejilense]
MTITTAKCAPGNTEGSSIERRDFPALFLSLVARMVFPHRFATRYGRRTVHFEAFVYLFTPVIWFDEVHPSQAPAPVAEKPDDVDFRARW